VAKKVRKKLKEEEAAAFEFPVFDEVAFVQKEYELTAGLALASLFAVLLGILGWVMTVAGIPWYGPFTVGLAGIVASPNVIRQLRRSSALYTKGDWAGLIALEFFGWLALWFVLLNVSPHAV
jgi:hypothetical protein